MFETPLPEIPAFLRKENTIDLYWEVSEPATNRSYYMLHLRHKYSTDEPGFKKEYEVKNPDKRWWNFKPSTIREIEEVPSQRKVFIKTIMSVYLSNKLNFTAENVYNASLNILSTINEGMEASNLIGVYPPKTLDLDPSLMDKE